MAEKNTTPQIDTSGGTPRPYDEAKMSDADIAKVENRATEDQIADYHQKNPTLKTTGAQYKEEPPTLFDIAGVKTTADGGKSA